MPNEMWNEITYAFPHFKVAQLKFGNKKKIVVYIILDAITHPC